MTVFWLDTEVATTMIGAWAARGDDLAASQLSIEADLDRLDLGTVQSTVVQRLATASTELWETSTFLHLVLQRAIRGDSALDAAAVAVLRDEAGHRVRISITDACPAPWVTPAYSSTFGDLGGRFGSELRSPFFAVGDTAAGRGRSVVARALTDTSSATQIRGDEFELVRLVNGAFLVVLPGVADLSSPDPGLSDRNRTPRDLDRVAYPSSRSTAVDDNHYARSVWDALDAAGVPPGADLMIVGHSFGADTALDLAADPGFNGPDGYHVTHVVAAGYYSNPQLEHLDPRTNVLVLQNHRDAAVIVEAVGYGHVTDAAESAGSVWRSARSFDIAGVVTGTASTAYHGAGALVDGVGYTIANADDLADAGIGVLTLDVDRIGDGVGDFVTLDPLVSTPGAGRTVDVFAGGAEGFGHHPSNYVDHVLDVDDPAVVAFFESVDAAGYAVAGTAWAIDISVPRD